MVEEPFQPSKVDHENYRFRDFVRKNPGQGPHLSQEARDAGDTDNLRQGGGIQVTAP
jgi:hypothetical protein